MAIAHDFHIPITTESDLAEFIRLAFGAVIPSTRTCANHATPWEAFCDAYFARSSVSVWKASRGFGGKSFLLALLGLTEAITLKADVNILGGSGEQSERVHDYTQGFWRHDSAPRGLLVSDPALRKTTLAWGNTIKALQASMASVRGPHPQRLRMDEIDEMKLPILDAAMGQPMSKGEIGPQTVLSSTHQYANATMTAILERAADKGWPVYEWCYQETREPHGWLPQTDIDIKRQDVSAAMWNVEYDLQEPSPESRAILPEAVQTMFKKALGQFEGRPGEYIEIEPPQPGARYAHGGDWAKKQDWTVIPTLRVDLDPMRFVAFKRTGRLPWPIMTRVLDDRLDRFGGTAVHDGTGLGDVVNDHLAHSIESFIMAGRKRSDLLSEYIAAIERGELEAPFIRVMEAEHRYASVDDVYGAGHLPDTIAAGALAYRAGSSPPPAGEVIDDLPASTYKAQRRSRWG